VPDRDRRDRVVADRVAVAGRSVLIERPADPKALYAALDELGPDERIPYWSELWPSSLVLAEALHEHPPRGWRVLELGCGLGVPSIVAKLEGASEVVACDWMGEAVEAAVANAARNGVQVRGLVASWFEPEPLLAEGPFDLVIAADVLYEARNAEPLLALLPRLLATGGQAWIADPFRATSVEVLDPFPLVRERVWRVA
jgi:predicted nicotinamide N-methyase